MEKKEKKKWENKGDKRIRHSQKSLKLSEACCFMHHPFPIHNTAHWNHTKVINLWDGRSEEQASGSEELCGWFSKRIRHEHCWRNHNIEGSRRFLWSAPQKSLPLMWSLHEPPHGQGGRPFFGSWHLHASLCNSYTLSPCNI